MTAVSRICSPKLLKLPVDSRLLENSNSFLIIQNSSSLKLFAVEVFLSQKSTVLTQAYCYCQWIQIEVFQINE